ncbi:hypothetical protein [Streptomyces chartreusis]|uniref:hypothetical protein n=1 Tax=Streptomyces chartreusis TaxID=1969 RepID=UPI003806D5A8
MAGRECDHGRGLVLHALLEHPGLTDHAVRRAADFADQWLKHNSGIEQAGLLIRQLTERPVMTDDDSTSITTFGTKE